MKSNKMVIGSIMLLGLMLSISCFAVVKNYVRITIINNTQNYVSVVSALAMHGQFVTTLKGDSASYPSQTQLQGGTNANPTLKIGPNGGEFVYAIGPKGSYGPNTKVGFQSSSGEDGLLIGIKYKAKDGLVPSCAMQNSNIPYNCLSTQSAGGIANVTVTFN